ncbi:MAG: hypothetical protein IIA10_01005 [Proteobacteria bacterium]|nr:hypothetical protein [Pseudomonadota bacterium]
MSRIRETLFDRLGDPASWAGAPLDFRAPSNGYYLATLASVSHSHDELTITVETEGKLFSSSFELKTISADDGLQPEQVTAMIQRRTGELLLEVLNIEIPESG